MDSFSQKRTASTGRPAVRSIFADDPQFQCVLASFVENLSDRQRDLEESFARGELQRLATLAHQLKGAAGGYGFADLSERAAALEMACQDCEIQAIGDRLESVVDLLSRISS
jgi:HPt (histidine-containing phosphotransfer) domain-containing protein